KLSHQAVPESDTALTTADEPAPRTLRSAGQGESLPADRAPAVDIATAEQIPTFRKPPVAPPEIVKTVDDGMVSCQPRRPAQAAPDAEQATMAPGEPEPQPARTPAADKPIDTMRSPENPELVPESEPAPQVEIEDPVTLRRPELEELVDSEPRTMPRDQPLDEGDPETLEPETREAATREPETLEPEPLERETLEPETVPRGEVEPQTMRSAGETPTGEPPPTLRSPGLPNAPTPEPQPSIDVVDAGPVKTEPMP